MSRVIPKYDESKRLKGMGDVVAKVAQPIAKAIDYVAHTNIKGCGGCRRRQEKLNQMFPFKLPHQGQ